MTQPSTCFHVGSKMFGEELEETLLENPDDECSRPVVDCPSTSSVGTPKRPQKLRKRKRGQDSAATACVAPNADTNRSRTKKMLSKKERSSVVSHIKKSPILEQVKIYFHKNECNIFQELISHGDLLVKLVNYHQNTFISLYESNATGKDKYISFQLEWHKYCSVFLLPRELPTQHLFSPPTNEMETIRTLWLDFTINPQIVEDKFKKFMMSFSSVVRDILLQETHLCLKDISDTTATGQGTTHSCNNDSDDVYFRFGGGTIASMLKQRYKEIRRCNVDKMELFSIEIAILQAINNKDKSSVPAYLQYRDRGNMYMPDMTFIPFFRAVDDCVKQVVNEKGFEEHGEEFIKVTHSHLKKATHLKSKFLHELGSKMATSSDKETQAANNVYEEMVTKLTNTRIQEFLSSLKQKTASKKGHASTTGQNLRDQLLTQHLQLQSRVQIN
ncbi:PREDICTED: uncharacterized protein LOC109584445 [Amphimedon queenslandica]|uniref:Uncharacterized protein n=1 Tax=Amphimedon queenslandica TaxID=400682 RepID=A0AAN0JG42_AMPQE|nr:PREDICTED: uncharacterized protein LOC109584445 [Amphimedon queenslandica]|eukprot:XP_019855757.1 PREDICTED: uncharacterized protein LOC109584445 [Amphimedon queenslandica]